MDTTGIIAACLQCRGVHVSEAFRRFQVGVSMHILAVEHSKYAFQSSLLLHADKKC